MMVAISWAWYSDSYTMAAKPIKSLELNYAMTQFFFVILDTLPWGHVQVEGKLLKGAVSWEISRFLAKIH